MAKVRQDFMGNGNGGTAAWDNANGYTQTRLYLVTDFSTGLQDSRQLRAMDLNEIPANNVGHPDRVNFGNLRVIGKSSTVIDEDKFLIAVKYGLPNIDDRPTSDAAVDAIVSVSTVLVETETAFDFANAQIFTSHTDNADGTPKKVPGKVRVFLASTEVRYQRREENSPGDKSKLYVGSLNQEGAFGDVPRTWMCSEISGNSNDGGASYIVNYAFIRSPHFIAGVVKPWDPTIVEINPETGTYVLDPQLDRGKKVVKVQRETVWSGMNLGLA